MKTNMRCQLLLFGGACLLFGACDEWGPRISPTLCVDAYEAAGSSGEPTCDVDASGSDEADLTDCPTAVVDGSGFRVIHELPAGVQPIGKLKVHIETSCEGADRDLEVEHVDGIAVLTGVVPLGGACGFLVTATMANSDLHCEVLPPEPCAEVTCE